MNKDYYNKLIEEEIKYLLEKKEDLCRNGMGYSIDYWSSKDIVKKGGEE